MSDLAERIAPPELADDVRLREMTGSTPVRWVISAGTDRYFRVGADLADLALALDGRRDVDGLCDVLGDRWDRDRVVGGLGVLESMRVLDTPESGTPPARRGRVRVVPPLTVQLTIVGSALHRLLPRERTPDARPRRSATAVAAVVAVLALGCYAALLPTTTDVLATAVDPWALAVVVLVTVVATGLHEYTHAWTLARFGGRVDRMGVMVFYLVPAFFCDVSDAWTLASRRERVVVALAGGGVQAVVVAVTSVGGLVAIASGAPPSVVQVLVLLATTSLTMVLVNLVPLVKLDGYIALMSALDIPHLRSKSIEATTASLRGLLFGTAVPTPARPWMPWFGLGCLAFPVVVVYLALANWSGALAATGVVGDTIVMLVSAYLVLLVVSALWRAVRRALADGARPVRVVLVVLAAAGVAVGVLGGVDVARSVSASYLRVGDTTVLVSTDRSALARVGNGREVTLLTNGLLLHRPVGHATTRGEVAPARFPLSAVLPTSGPDIPAPGYGLALDTTVDPTAPDSGLARITVGRTSLGAHLLDRFVWPASLRGGVVDLWRAVTR